VRRIKIKIPKSINIEKKDRNANNKNPKKRRGKIMILNTFLPKLVYFQSHIKKFTPTQKNQMNPYPI